MEADGKRSWGEALLVYTRPPVIAMGFLGFSAGLPYMLVFTTLTVWLREAEVSRSAIGLFSWLGVTYSIKFIWSPVVDRLAFPGLSRLLGQRRGWMLAGQLGIATGLVGLAVVDPQRHLLPIAVFGLLVAFSSATQDVALDAFRIEKVAVDLQAAMASTYILGYRIAVLVSYTGALFVADYLSWSVAYLGMAALVSVGIVTVLLVAEPGHHTDRTALEHEQRVRDFLARSAAMNPTLRRLRAWLIGAVVCPFTDFVARHGAMTVAVLALVATFRISDITMGSMAGPLYVDLGFDKSVIATITGAWGLAATIAGAGLGGVAVLRYGIMAPLLAAAIAVAATNLLFAYMASAEPGWPLLTAVIGADNLSGGFAIAVFIAYLSSLVNTAYTATQYALLSSLMTLPGKLLSGLGGFVVDAQGYVAFFLYASALGVPAIALVVYLWHRRPPPERDAEPAP